MKKLVAIFAIVLFSSTAFSQKIAVVDSKYIMENIPEYNAAQDQLDEFSVNWQKEIEAKFTEISKLYENYKAEQVLLPEDMKQKRIAEIEKKEKDAKDLQKQRFGKDGDLFKKRQELIKPVQDKIYNAINEIATTGNYQVIFDKSSDLIMLYVNTKIDISDEVLAKLGYTPGGQKKTEQKSK